MLTWASLVVNIIAGEVVEPMRRTAVFGMLQGALMLGQGIGYLSKLHSPSNLTNYCIPNNPMQPVA